jgi:adenylate cyclase
VLKAVRCLARGVDSLACEVASFVDHVKTIPVRICATLASHALRTIHARGGRYPRNLPLEVERKFLVARRPDWLPKCRVEEIEQGYLAIQGDDVEVRLRRLAEGRYLTVKRGSGSERAEVEVELSAEQFEALWPLTAGRRLRKARHYVQAEAGEIEVDVYRGPLEGLITAEVEFGPGQPPGSFEPPDWIGEELTGHPGYANKNLATHGIPKPPRPRRVIPG